MSNAGKNSMRWLETTSTMQAAPQAEAANNIPSRRFGSSQEESKIVPLKTTTLAVAKPTTATTMFDAAATAGKNSGSDSAAPLVKRITASPGMIKTQIAKISYTYPDDRSPPHSTQKYIKPMTTMIQRIHLENPTTPHSAQHLDTVKSSVEDYAHKKCERELEIREIQEMLEEITKTPPISNEIQNELPTSLKETTNNAPKFKEITNESTKITHDNITNTARTAEKPTPPNSVVEAEIANIPAEVDQPAKTTEKPPTSATSNRIFQKSKTDLNLLPAKAATTRWRKSVREPPNEPRSKSTQLPATKSSELLPGGSPDKKKSYNPQEARRFMEEQRKKRQKNLDFISSHRSQQQKEKEQIKRRLEDLRKYSRKVVSKNLTNAQKRSGASTTMGAGGGAGTGGEVVDEASPRKTAKLDGIVFKRAQDRKNQQNKSTMKTTKNPETKTAAQAENLGLEIVRKPEEQKQTQSKAERKDGGKPNALMENQKRVGLLRKPEIKDHSFGAIKEFSFDKENVALDLLTPKLTIPVEQPRIKDKVIMPPTTGSEVQQQANAEPPQPQPNRSVSMNNLLLEMPEARLHRTRVVREQATQVRESPSLMLTADSAKASSIAQTPAQNERNELPYWLKPSAVQVYPYNFIMAVRRKLEAIANPPQPPTVKRISCDEISLKKPADTPLSSMPKDSNAATAHQNVKRRLMVADIAEESHSAEFATHSIESAAKKSPVKYKQEAQQKSQETPPPAQLLSQTTYSDVTSNFSSISLLLPVSNTCSEVSSIKSDSNVTHIKPSKTVKNIQSAEEDNTTASSSIFNSPDKQKRIGKRPEGREFKVPRPVSPLSLESIEHLKISSKAKETNIAKRVAQESAEVVEVDFNRLLQDFNRSLSQVIEVNEQLKSTLDKSQQLISPERKHSSNNSTDRRHAVEDEYSTDFEGGSSANAEFEQIATRVIKKNPLPHHRKNLFELANIVKPLPTSSKSDTGSGATATSHRKNKLQNLDINLESMDNSSVENTTPSKTKFSSLTSADSLDRRLQSIEQLKNNLRESILISKANRSEIKNDVERRMHNLTTSTKEENQPLLDKPDAESDVQRSVSKKQKPSHSLSNSTVDSRRVSSKRSLLLHFSSEPSDIQTALSENDANSAQISASTQSADAATMLSASSSSVADKSYTFDSKSNSPKAKTFTITQNVVVTTTHSLPAQKSTDLEVEDEETIAEELQNIATTPEKHNNNAPALQQGIQKTSNSSADSSPTTSKQGATKAAYVKAHINRSRGDFMPATDDDNAVSNESHFHAAATVAAANDTRTDSDSAAPPPSYKAISATTKTANLRSDNKSASLQQKFANKSSKHALGHELITVFNQSDMELSIISSRNGSISETSLNYSSVGLYEKLIQTETTKSEQLTMLLKMREKALLDRTKGQIAWLELQKERYKAKGLLVQITAIKKKQRGILLKMEKEREEIKRLLQSTNSTTSTHSSARHHFHHSAGVQQQHQTQTTSPKRKRAEPRSAPPRLLPLPILPKTTRSSSTAQQQQQQKISTVHSAPIIRANYELESSRTLEDLLQKREADLRKRREHVERLILWHQRLDQEEAEVQQLELMLLNYNNVHAQPLNENHSPQQQRQQQQQQQTASSDKQQSQEQLTAAVKPSPHKKQGRDAKMERRLKEIDKSLRELSSISVSNNSATSTDESATSDADFVRTSGNKLNKLWRRLTTQQVERFEATRRYKLCKADLERLYEEAKLAVLRDFAQDEHRVAVELLDKTTATVLSQSSLQESLNHEAAAEITNNKIVIPRLNLNFSSGQSDPEDAMVQLKHEEDSTESMAEAVSTQSTLPPTTQGDTYSPCIAEEEFIRQESCSSSLSTTSSCSSQNKDTLQVSAEFIERHREELLERNVQKFMELTQRFNGAQPGDGLQRSLSDTQIAENCSGVSKKSSNKAAISQRNIAYYGVKTQKRPSKVVNVEIANSLSSASSILTASSTLRSVQSLKTQTFSELNSNSNNYAQHTSNSKPLSANVNNIPLPVSNLTTMTSTTTTTTVASSMVDSLDSCHIGESLASNSAPITSQATINATPSSTASLSNVATAATLTKSDKQAQQISEKLEEISAAVSKLTQSNSLIVSGSSNSTNSKPPSQQQLQIEQSTKSSSTEINTDHAGQTATTSYSYSYTFELNEPEIMQSLSAPESATMISSISLLQTQTVPSTSLQTPPLNDTSELLSETMLLAKYNADFEDTLDETRLEDISLPQFETTNESTQNEEEEDEIEKDEEQKQSSKVTSTSPLEILAKTTNNFSQVSATLPPPPMPPPPPPPPATSTTTQLPSTSKEAAVTAAATNNNNNNSSSQPQLMPDIINELELRRCQQQIQQYEHVTAVPYNMYVREIPNKPPPPYVPPAHGSPMTTIFPSEERIKDLTYRRTHELYCEILKTEYTNEKGEKLPSVLAEKITNIYERIILDICREYLDENNEVLTKSDPSTFHGNLAFFNPPDRLSCLQTFVYKEVRRCLAMDKKQPKRSQVYSVYGQRAKRDHIGKIIIQEMYDEDDKWCNFHHEEAEVLDLIIEEMLTNLVGDIAKEVLLEEGGTIDEVEAQVEEEMEVEQNVTNDETIYEDVSLIESTTSALDAVVIETETIQQNSINAETNAPVATT